MHEHEHEHTHVNTDGSTYTHTHDHEHEHEHDHSHDHDTHEHQHEHGHDHGHVVTPAALLAHMTEHNKNHLEELKNVAAQLSGEAAEKMQAAIDTMAEGNRQLEEVLDLLKEQ